MSLRKVSGSLYALPLILLALIALGIPSLMLIRTSLFDGGQITFEHYVSVLSSAYERSAIFTSLRFALYQTLLCVLLGTPIAFSILRLSNRSRSLIMAFINVASSFGGPGLVFAYMLLTGATGVLTAIWVGWLGQSDFPSQGSMAGLNAIMLYVHLPLYLVLSLSNYDSLRPEWAEAALMSGASRFQYFRRVAIPVLTPFVIGNALQLFTWAMGAYAIPYVVTQSPNAVNLVSVVIGRNLDAAIFGREQAATLATLLMLQAIALTWIYSSFQKRGEKIL